MLIASAAAPQDGLPWRSIPQNATVQWRRMADNTLVLAQVGPGCKLGMVAAACRRAMVGCNACAAARTEGSVGLISGVPACRGVSANFRIRASEIL